MKKILFTAILTLFTMGVMQAQAYSGASDQKISLGFVPWGYGSGLSVIYDHGISDIVSLGAGGEIYFGDEHNDGNFYIFGRANFHLGKVLDMPSNMDLYPGVDVGFNDGLGLGAHLGFRYLFNDKIGAYIEAGSRGSLGILFNL